MDEKPFLEIDLERQKDLTNAEIKKMAKEGFDLDRMLSTASELKYTSEIKKVITAEVENPSEELVRYFFKKTSPKGMFTAAMKEYFTPLVAKAFRVFVNDKIDDRLRSALEHAGNSNTEKDEEDSATQIMPENDHGIITTEEELDGYRVVVAICSQKVSPERIVHRDTKSYMGILLDDNNRKPICRLWFNTKQKYLGVFDAQKNEERIPVEKVTDLYLKADRILAMIDHYEQHDA